MGIFLIIVINIVVVYAWIWIIDMIFGQNAKIKLNITIKIFLIWLFLVAGLFFYRYFLGMIGKSDFYFLQEQNLSTVSIFLFFCDILFLILSLLFKSIAKKSIITIFLVINVLFFGIYFAWYGLWISIAIMYYIISSYAEEYLKYGAWSDMFLKESSEKKSADLIFFCMLMALGFSIVENIFYVWYSLYSGEQINVVSMLVSRWLVSTLIHVVSTWLIALVYIKAKAKINVFVSVILWFLAGIAIHSAYNLSLHFKLRYLIVAFVALWYFAMTYLIYNSDRVYRGKNSAGMQSRR